MKITHLNIAFRRFRKNNLLKIYTSGFSSNVKSLEVMILILKIRKKLNKLRTNHFS